MILRSGMSGGYYSPEEEAAIMGPQPAPQSPIDSIKASAARSLSFDPITITGNDPPSLFRSALPWLIGAAVVGAVWWIAYDQRKRRRARRNGGAPFVG